jgi:peptidylprolyl isomerase
VRRIVVIALLLCAAALAIVGCGGGGSSRPTSTSANASAQEGSSQAGGKGEISQGKNGGARLSGAEPRIPKASGPPPKQLVTKTFIPGDGKTAADGDKVTVRFVGANYRTGRKFNSSWVTGGPVTFTLGAKEVIPGWDEGVAGMKENGRYELIVPPELAFGAKGIPPRIPPNETLVYLIDVTVVS